MPRRARVCLPNIPLHIIQCGHNRTACFFADEDYGFYLDWLENYATQTHCRVHAYALMTNHVHLLLTADDAEGPGALMKALGQPMSSTSTTPIGVVGRCGRAASGPV